MSEEIKEIQCQGVGCGRMAEKIDEDYYACHRCGWAGSEDNPIVVLQRKVKKLQFELADCHDDLRDCHDLLNDCGFFYEGGTWVDGDNREEE